MKLEVARKIKKAADDMLPACMEILEDYSGRGMYGRSTAAITVSDFSTFVQAVALAAMDVAQDSGESDDGDDSEAFVEALGGLRQDSLGHDIVIY